MKNVSLMYKLNNELPTFGVLGIPGTGKTTVSKKIGEMLDREVVNVDATLKQKMKGRNRDINVADMTNYQETKELIEKHQKEIDSISNNSLELKTNSNNIKELPSNLFKMLLVT